MSVSHYQDNVGQPAYAGERRRSSIAPAGSFSAGDAQKSGVLNQRDETLRKMSVAVPNLAELSADAKVAADSERKMGFMEGVKLYPLAIFFSFGLSLAVVMEGYDTWLLGSFYGMPAFAEKFGEAYQDAETGETKYEVNVSWQNALGNGTAAAQIIGLMINGIVSERIGYRWTMMGALVLVSAFIFIQFFAKNIHMLLAGYVLAGLPWGVFQTLTVTYASEVCPVPLRPYLTTYVNLCWVMGQLIASGVLKGFAAGLDQWAWRVPYAVQWVWPLPIGLVTFFAPESPWWLVRHGKIDQARAALIKLTSKKNNPDFNVEDTVAMIIHTNELEIQQTSGTSYWDCFKGVDLRRTELTVMSWVIQQTSGSPMMGWGTYFMIQAGLDPNNAFSLGVGQSAMGFVGTVASWFLLPHFGRRTLYIWGQVAMLIILCIIGGLGIPQLGTSTGWATGALILVLTFAYDITVGPVCYSLVAELPCTRLRIKTVVLARNVYNICGIIIGTLQPRFMNPDSGWGWRGKTAFFWAGANVLGLIWTYFRLPEPKVRLPFIILAAVQQC
jgi:MFS transporter, SP family, general alpha glucoside:H+ symporter